MSQETPVLTISRTPTAAVAINRFVDFAGNQLTAAGAMALGVANMPTEAVLGRPIPVRVLGTCKVEAGAAIAFAAAGAPVKSDASGRAIAQAGTGVILGYALEAAIGAGDTIEILLAPK